MNDQSGLQDLQFNATIDSSIQQNVPIPNTPPSLSGMNGAIDSSTKNSDSDQNKSNFISQIFKNSSHPIPCLFHILFKGCAIVLYVLGGLFSRNSSANFITVTVICILLLAADFWVVKNITGRLLVGLRWWSYVDGPEFNETRWVYESAEEGYKANSFDSSVFWAVLYITPCIWTFFLFMGLIKFNFGWLIVVFFGLGLSLSNMYCFWECSKDQKAKVEQYIQSTAQMGAMSMIKNNTLGAVSSLTSGLANVLAGSKKSESTNNSSGNGSVPMQQFT